MKIMGEEGSMGRSAEESSLILNRSWGVMGGGMSIVNESEEELVE